MGKLFISTSLISAPIPLFFDMSKRLMNSILVANSVSSEQKKIKKMIDQEYNVSCIGSLNDPEPNFDDFDLVLLDHNFTDNSGLDFLKQIVKESCIPVLMITPADDFQCAIEAIRVGAFNYIVKTGVFLELINISVKEAINRFNELEHMKQTITDLRKRVAEMETRLCRYEKTDGKELPSSAKFVQKKEIEKPTIIQEIVARFKQGEINLPSMPEIALKFKESIDKGDGIGDIANLLKQDIAISSKLINVSNSVFYKGASENMTLEDAISRLGLSVTKQYVDVISNRSFYVMTDGKKYKNYFEQLWRHSLACAYASQNVALHFNLKLKNDPFIMGLLHDIGKLVLLQILSELTLKNEFYKDLSKAQLFKTLKEFHGKFGAVLLKRWNYDKGAIRVVIYHDHINRADVISKELLVVNFANMLVNSMGYTLGRQEEIELENAESTRLLKITPELIEEFSDKVKKQMNATLNILS